MKKIRIEFTKPWQTQSIWHWLLWNWDFRIDWEEPYKLVRTKGFRILGITIEWEYIDKGD